MRKNCFKIYRRIDYLRNPLHILLVYPRPPQQLSGMGDGLCSAEKAGKLKFASEHLYPCA